MEIIVDNFLDRQPSANYNCFDFVREVAATYRDDILEQFPFLGQGFKTRKLEVTHMRAFKRLIAPVDGCFVVFQRHRWVPHIGIWWHGRVLHLGACGAAYERLDVVARRFPKVGFFV